MNRWNAVERVLGIRILGSYPLCSSEAWLVGTIIHWQTNEVAPPGRMGKCISYRKNARFAEDVPPSGDGQSGLFSLTSMEEASDTEKFPGVGAKFLKHWGGE